MTCFQMLFRTLCSQLSFKFAFVRLYLPRNFYVVNLPVVRITFNISIMVCFQIAVLLNNLDVRNLS